MIGVYLYKYTYERIEYIQIHMYNVHTYEYVYNYTQWKVQWKVGTATYIPNWSNSEKFKTIKFFHYFTRL